MRAGRFALSSYAEKTRSYAENTRSGGGEAPQHLRELSGRGASMKAYTGHTGVQVNHTTHCAVAERRIQKREISVKKSIAVLSLTIAGALGLAACGGNSGTNSNSSASATASATASAPASTSAAATSESTTSAAAETTKAETKTTQGTISAPSGLPSEATEALKKGQESANQAASAGYTASKKGLDQLKNEAGVKKVQTSDGTVYYTDKLAAFESKDGAIISIQNNGVWTSMDSNGTTIVVKEDGSWIKTNPKDNLYTVVNADGTASVLNTKTFEQATDVSTIETPKAPGRIDGFSGTAKTPVKPTKIGDLSEVAGAK